MSSEQKKLHDEILEKVREYHDKFHLEKNNKEFVEGDRISYSGRVYDADEMTTLVDAALEFWLTQGRYSEEFEKRLADYVGRLAAGRALITNDGEAAFSGGASATITGNMLTTSGSTIESDKKLLSGIGRDVTPEYMK